MPSIVRNCSFGYQVFLKILPNTHKNSYNVYLNPPLTSPFTNELLGFGLLLIFITTEFIYSNYKQRSYYHINTTFQIWERGKCLQLNHNCPEHQGATVMNITAQSLN